MGFLKSMFRSQAMVEPRLDAAFEKIVQEFNATDDSISALQSQLKETIRKIQKEGLRINEEKVEIEDQTKRVNNSSIVFITDLRQRVDKILRDLQITFRNSK